MEKKQIVFIWPFQERSATRTARALKHKERYETVLVTLKKIIDKDFVEDTYDKILCLELDFSISPKNIPRLLKILASKKAKSFFKEINKLKPYVVQINGHSLAAFLFWLLLKKRPKIAFLGDIWHHAEKKLSFKKNTGRLQYMHTFVEKFIFKKADGIINKWGEGSLDSLKSKIKGPVLDFLPYCLDEWIVPPKKKNPRKNKEIHIVYAGTSWLQWNGHAPFKDMIEKIINQGIHLHFYPSKIKEEVKIMLENLAKKNRFLHLYSRLDRNKIKKEISKYDYAIHLDFCDDSVSSKWLKNAVSTKIFVYIEAGLPIFINKQFKNMTNIIERNNMGCGITYEDLGNLKKIIAEYKYPTIKEIKTAQDNLRRSKHIHRLEKFYDKIHAQSMKR